MPQSALVTQGPSHLPPLAAKEDPRRPSSKPRQNSWVLLQHGLLFEHWSLKDCFFVFSSFLSCIRWSSRITCFLCDFWVTSLLNITVHFQISWDIVGCSYSVWMVILTNTKLDCRRDSNYVCFIINDKVNIELGRKFWWRTWAFKRFIFNDDYIFLSIYKSETIEIKLPEDDFMFC